MYNEIYSIKYCYTRKRLKIQKQKQMKVLELKLYISHHLNLGVFSLGVQKKKHFCAVARPEGLRHIASWLVTDKGDSELEWGMERATEGEVTDKSDSELEWRSAEREREREMHWLLPTKTKYYMHNGS